MEYQVITRLSEHDQPLLGECVVHAGDARITFKNGRAKVSAEQAHLIAHREDVEIVGYDPDTDPYNPAATNPAPKPEGAEAPIEEDAPVEGDRTILDEVPQPSKASENADPDAVALAQEHLAEEGEAVPEPETPEDEEEEAGPILPEGFSLTTEDGEDRCLAAKGDGSQCANVASDGHACGIASHREQVASRA